MSVSNSYGFSYQPLEFGSMIQELILDYTINFIKHLPAADQGNDKKLVVFLHDRHISRWDPKYRLYFMNKNVYFFMLASHTSN